ncbi:hypothetical protein LZ009_14875 [Ramlibacter sp. XY19]|uniref:hypothetical protein n=1 Tax=Ramlibacter paludis TaxID=2908000 RepID=UPI0023DBF934|nr:hypothetical protein [Ramlibacter paludis]MCG2594062.1 hypothetical protein [Ramlibacter paludis]
MNIPLLLLPLALAAGAAWYFGRAKGLLAFLALLLAGTGAAYVASTNAALAIGFALAFALPYVIGAIALGVLAGWLARRRPRWLAVLPFLPFLYFAWSVQNAVRVAPNEGELALDYVMQLPQLRVLAGRPIDVTSVDRQNDWYVFSLAGTRPLFVLLDVRRTSGRPLFKLACVTSVAPASRADCEGPGVVPLPQ